MVSTTASPSPPQPRTLRRSPPRRALHERSESETNTVVNPSIRVVPDSLVFASTPFPTQPSQVLLPRRGSRFDNHNCGSGTPLVSSEDPTVSSIHYPGRRSYRPPSSGPPKASANFSKPSPDTSYTEPLTNWTRWTDQPNQQSPPPRRVNAPSTIAPVGLLPTATTVNASTAARAMTSSAAHDDPRHGAGQQQQQQQGRSGASTAADHAGLALSPPNIGSVTLAAPASAKTSLTPDLDRQRLSSDRSRGDDARAAGNNARGTRSNLTTAPPTSALPNWLAHDPTPAAARQRLQSVVSLTSSASSETLGGGLSPKGSHKGRSRRPSASYSAFPPGPSTARPTTPPRAAPASNPSKGSSTSASSTSHKTSSSSRSGSPPSDVQAVPAIRPGPRLQYPVVRGPSAQGSFADTAISLPKRGRMPEDTPPHPSRAVTDHSRELPFEKPLPERPEPERTSESSTHSRNRSLNSHPVPTELRRPTRAEKGKGRATIRPVEEQREEAEGHERQVRRSNRHSMLAVPAQSKRNSRGDLPDRPSSRASFMAVGVPNWAK